MGVIHLQMVTEALSSTNLYTWAEEDQASIIKKSVIKARARVFQKEKRAQPHKTFLRGSKMRSGNC